MHYLKMDISKIAGLRTIEEIEELLKIRRSYALKLMSSLKKQGYVGVSGGGRQKRIYKITAYKQTKSNGMFDIINRHSRLKVQPLFRHIVEGSYSAENALIDAIALRKKRVILAALNLFNHIKDWKKLKELARKKQLEAEAGMLYDLARKNIKTRKMPENIYMSLKRAKKPKQIIDEKTEELDKRWNCYVPFSRTDIERLKE